MKFSLPEGQTNLAARKNTKTCLLCRPYWFKASMNNHLIVSNVSDASFAIGVAHACTQLVDISDMVSLKSFVNSEFCPRFMQDDVGEDTLGHGLDGKSV